MAEFQLTGLLTDLIHWEIHDPAELVTILLHVLLIGCTQQLSQNTCGLLCHQLLTCGQTDKISWLQAQCVDNSILAILQEFGDTSNQLSVLVHLKPERLVGCLHLNLRANTINHLTCGSKSIYHDSLDSLSLEWTETTICHHLGSIRKCQVNTKIRLVRAVLVHSLKIWNTHKRSLGCGLVNTVFLENRRKHLFYNGEHIFLGSKCHLHIQLIELSRRTVCAGILITETRSNLEIAVKTGSHQNLLELLRSLWQCVELARMIPCRYKVVSCALRRRAGQNRCGNLHKVQRIHSLAKFSHNLASHNNIALHCRVSQIQIAVLESCILICLSGLIDFKRKRIVDALSENLDFLRNYLDLTGRKLHILAGTLTNGSGDGQCRLLVHTVDDSHHILGLHYHLRCSVKVAQNQKSQISADFTHILIPSDDGYLVPCVCDAQFVTIMCSGLNHCFSPFILPIFRNRYYLLKNSTNSSYPSFDNCSFWNFLFLFIRTTSTCCPCSLASFAWLITSTSLSAG